MSHRERRRKRLRTIQYFILLIVLLAVLIYLLIKWMQAPPATKSPLSHFHTGPTIEQIHQLSWLVATRVDVSDVQLTEINGRTGGVRAILLIKGDLLLAVDMQQAKIDKVNEQAKTATLLLPNPTIASPRVNHDKTKLYAVDEYGLWYLVPGNQANISAINHAYREAQETVKSAGAEAAVVGKAKQHAEHALRGYYEAIGWRITVLWADR